MDLSSIGKRSGFNSSKRIAPPFPTLEPVGRTVCGRMSLELWSGFSLGWFKTQVVKGSPQVLLVTSVPSHVTNRLVTTLGFRRKRPQVYYTGRNSHSVTLPPFGPIKLLSNY